MTDITDKLNGMITEEIVAVDDLSVICFIETQSEINYIIGYMERYCKSIFSFEIDSYKSDLYIKIFNIKVIDINQDEREEPISLDFNIGFIIDSEYIRRTKAYKDAISKEDILILNMADPNTFFTIQSYKEVSHILIKLIEKEI